MKNDNLWYKVGTYLERWPLMSVENYQSISWPGTLGIFALPCVKLLAIDIGNKVLERVQTHSRELLVEHLVDGLLLLTFGQIILISHLDYLLQQICPINILPQLILAPIAQELQLHCFPPLLCLGINVLVILDLCNNNIALDAPAPCRWSRLYCYNTIPHIL